MEQEFLDHYTNNSWRNLYTVTRTVIYLHDGHRLKLLLLFQQICIESRNNSYSSKEASKPENRHFNR